MFLFTVTTFKVRDYILFYVFATNMLSFRALIMIQGKYHLPLVSVFFHICIPFENNVFFVSSYNGMHYSIYGRNIKYILTSFNCLSWLLRTTARMFLEIHLKFYRVNFSTFQAKSSRLISFYSNLFNLIHVLFLKGHYQEEPFSYF